ncbi:universal stress protein [Actinospica robiniae]|uniref:universal stress protein n=1 Tax=Actinospica robiniae TaxID=304901 RepID=UPI000686DA19|nr:universal stress protein [Actinospica robiniae]
MASKIIGRVIVGVDGSPGSLEALRYALGQARRLEAVLMPVLAWDPPGGQVAARRAPSPQYHRILRECAEAALRQAFDQGLGGVPDDVAAEGLVIMGAAGAALVQTADRGNDLLVIGAGRRGSLSHPFRANTARYCLAHAVCPVIAVPPPRLQAALPARMRRRREIGHLLHELANADPAALPLSSGKDL